MTQTQSPGPLFTDLYELTMGAGYYEHKVFSEATFSLFIRNYPLGRRYFVAAGLEDVLNGLSDLHFSESDIAYLKSTGLFSEAFIEYLKGFRFSGNVYAMPEGTIFFANEPVLEVTAPIIEAQLIETFLLNTVGFPILVASKAARCIHAAKNRQLVDFSLRRTQGVDPGMKVARNSYIAGFSATSNVLAGKRLRIPISGTMAHSFVMAFDDEVSAFLAYSKTFPMNSVFLIDTYDTLKGARNAVKVAKEMEKKGASLVGVRLDSGDMADLSIKVRKIFDDAGLPHIKIFASSGFDEYKITDVISKGAKIDSFGVGTKLGVSADAPYLDIVYKMVRFKDNDVRKLSPDKATLAGKKQVFRKYDAKGQFQEDIIGIREEHMDYAILLLEKVMEYGKCLRPHPPLEIIRTQFSENFELLPETYKSLDHQQPYPVSLSKRLSDIQEMGLDR